MEYRQLGNSDVKVSAIAFGAWAIGGWMWGGTDREDALDAIWASYDYGVTTIDTAPIYGQGLSEEIVGEAIGSLPRDKVQILTKFGMRWNDTKGAFAFSSSDNAGNPIDVYKYAGKKSVIKECEDSLRRLGTDYIDLYQIHWPDNSTPVADTMEALAELYNQGKIRAAGVSNYSVSLMAEAEKAITLVSNQVPYSMVERSIEKELVPYCINHDKAILAYSPLQGGLLTGKIKPGHVFAPGDHRPKSEFYRADNIRRINRFLGKLEPIARSKASTLSQIAIRWTIEQPGITIALVGARYLEQAIQNAKAINVQLSKDEIEFINSELKELEIASEEVHA
jgi:aryl-alcohol dehydrogenase-like predicted oxidoreductase